jgi:hypothetical protein
MPMKISYVIQAEGDLPYQSVDVTLTSDGNVVVAKYQGVLADVYSQNLSHLYNVNLTGAVDLRGLTSQGDAVFLVDDTAQGIHVVLNNGRNYSH